MALDVCQECGQEIRRPPEVLVLDNADEANRYLEQGWGLFQVLASDKSSTGFAFVLVNA